MEQVWFKTQRMAIRLRPPKKKHPPTNKLRRAAYRMVHTKHFDLIVNCAIALNTIFLAIKYYEEPDVISTIIEKAFFAAFFTLEAATKLIGLGPKEYFDQGWHRFDFTIVFFTNAGLIVKWTTDVNFGSIATVIRSMRIGRLLRLSRKTKGLLKIFNTFILALPALINIGTLLFLLFFIYATMGVQMFAKVGFMGQITPNCNFQSVGMAMLSLLRFSTGESWSDFARDMAQKPDGCVVDPSYDPYNVWVP